MIWQGALPHLTDRVKLAKALERHSIRPVCSGAALSDFAGADLSDWGCDLSFADAPLASVIAARPTAVIVEPLDDRVEALREAGIEVVFRIVSADQVAAARLAGVRTLLVHAAESWRGDGAPAAVLWPAVAEAISADARRWRLILAGGLSDHASATRAEELVSIARGAAVDLCAGSALLLTHESAEAGVPSLVLQRGLAAGALAPLGSLKLRCAPNDAARELTVMESAQTLRWALRRLRLAADPETPPRRRDEAGLYPCGLASPAHELRTVSQVAAALEHRATRPDVLRIRSPTTQSSAREGAIAVVGLGVMLPDALDVRSLWRNLIEGRCSIREVRRWDPARYHDPDAGTSGPVKSYSALAATVDEPDLDPERFRIPPAALPTLDRSQRLALLAADQAVRSAGWHVRGPSPQRAAVILGNAMGGQHSKDMVLRVRFREVLAAADRIGQRVDSDDLEAELARELPPVQPDSMSGLLSNIVAARVASWLGWMGGASTVDAACAASLSALHVAVDQLRNRRVDAVLSGGVDTDLTPETFVGFSRTMALSAQGSVPFSADADGFVMGEGAAVFALMRLEDAEREGRQVWAVLEGIGQSSDGRGRSITAPRPEGQRLAIERALEDAAVEPETVVAVEAHGTSTVVGDRTELEVLSDIYDRPWVGSIKSNLGHLKSAAGAAGLAKAVLAVATGVLPQTLHAAPLSDEAASVKLPRNPVHVDGPIAVSAFGFGGANVHAILRGHSSRPPLALQLVELAEPLTVEKPAWTAQDRTDTLLCYAAQSREQLVDAVRADARVGADAAASAPWRLALTTTWSDRHSAREEALQGLRDGVERGPVGVSAFVGRGPPRQPVWLFPGQGSTRPGSLARAACTADALRVLHALCAQTLNDAETDAVSQHRVGLAVAAAWSATLHAAGTGVRATLGHSFGEIGALVGSGRIDHVAAADLAEARGRALADCPAGAMVAVETGAVAASFLAERHGLSLAAINGPRQCVLSGPTDAVARCEGRQLRVPHAYHSSAMAPAARALGVHLAEVQFAPSDVAAWSSARARAFPADPRPWLVEAITGTVRFADALERVGEPHGLFIEVGPGGTLGRLGRHTLPAAVFISVDRGAAAAAAALVAEGHAGLAQALPGTVLRQAAPGQARSKTTARAEPAAAPVIPLEGIRGAVITALCDITGYTPDALIEVQDLEADLGIDSIRKLEVLELLQRRLGLPERQEDYRMLASADLDTLVAHLQARVDTELAAVG